MYEVDLPVDPLPHAAHLLMNELEKKSFHETLPPPPRHLLLDELDRARLPQGWR